ncbi:MAG: DNA-binding response regulator [Flavobacterium sp. BFFFF1]|uniref:LuxR C-terminal-related transcriptional regulator n=1 Tax=unclassified Flavobacterium TaxID=196869 RepID=UPI000BCBBCC0|nr:MULTISPECIES: response regulator transcription factor [unclassified Flavobacterium]OYU80465.1 MAG: DNA-binding response regulator [Flavobacterium sp. BFFFF1]
MIKVAIADNQPVVHFGIDSFFKGHPQISIVGHYWNFNEIPEALANDKPDILVLDLDLEGLASMNYVKSLVKEFPFTRIVIYSNLSEQTYTPNAIKAGIASYIHKSSQLEKLEDAILRVNQGEVIFSDDVRKKLLAISKQNKSERLYRKLSSREIEVLRYLSDGKKNNEIAKLLDLNEKTISTYKLRLLNKLNVTNLVDLVNKAKKLEIV